MAIVLSELILGFGTTKISIQEPGAEKVVHQSSMSSRYQPTAVRKTTFFLVLVEGVTVAPNLDPNLLASWWLLGQRTPIVFLSCETQTTEPMV